MYVVGPVLALLRLPVVALLLGVLAANSFFLSLVFISALKRPLSFLLLSLPARLLLLVLGYWWIPTQWTRILKKNKLPTEYPGAGVGGGHLLIGNKTSYAELLYLQFRFSPLFVAAPTVWQGDAPPSGVAAKRTFMQALFDCVGDPLITEEQCQPLSQIVAEARAGGLGPVVVFPEGTTSNGKCLLRLTPVLAGANISSRFCHIIGFKHDWSHFCPTYTVGSPLAHLFRLCCQVHNSLQVRFLSNLDFPPSPLDQEGSAEQEGEENDGGEEEDEEGEGKPQGEWEGWAERVGQQLANALGLKRAALDVQGKREFLRYARDYRSAHLRASHSLPAKRLS